MADISNIVTVSLQADQLLAVGDNVNDVAIITTDRAFLNSGKRHAVYKNASEVAADFGSNNVVTAFASVLLAQQPNPVNAGGKLIIGYWRASAETVAATAGELDGAQLNELDVVAQLQQITAGTMSVTVDAVAVPLTALDFSPINTMDDAVAILDAVISTADVTHENLAVKITSKTTGAASAVSFATGDGDGYVGSILGLTDGVGAVSVPGEAATTPAIETETEALDALASEISFKGFMFIDESTDAQRLTISAWTMAHGVLGYDVFSNPTSLVRDISNVPWAVKLAGQKNYRMLYSKKNARTLAVAYMGRNHTVNFNAQNTTITMNLKTLVNVTPEDFTQSEIDAAKTIGLDIYTTFKNVPAVRCSSGNGFVDNEYNLIAYKESVVTDVFNLLKGTTTKIAQTTPDVNLMVDVIRAATDAYVSARAFGPGTWTRSDTFGNLDTFNNAIENEGYYILAGLISIQNPVDRQERKSPVIQLAVKSQGAIHSADIIINFNL
jgi:hypothetical protein